MREPPISLKKYNLSRFVYMELKAICRQYPDKVKEANSLLSVSSPQLTGMPHGNGTSSPVERAVERREKLMNDIAQIEAAASAPSEGRFKQAIILNTCYGVAYDKLPWESVPTSNRNAFFSARREFFYLLYRMRNTTV